MNRSAALTGLVALIAFSAAIVTGLWRASPPAVSATLFLIDKAANPFALFTAPIDMEQIGSDYRILVR